MVNEQKEVLYDQLVKPYNCITNYLTRWVHTTQNLITPISPCQSPTIWPGECTQLETLLRLSHLVSHRLSDQVSAHNSKPYCAYLTLSVTDYLTRWEHTTQNLITPISPCQSLTIWPGESTQLKTLLHLTRLVGHQLSDQVSTHNSKPYYTYLTCPLPTISPGACTQLKTLLHLSHLVSHWLSDQVSVHNSKPYYTYLTWSITNYLTRCVHTTQNLITSVLRSPSPTISPGEYTQLKTTLQLSHLVHQQLSHQAKT